LVIVIVVVIAVAIVLLLLIMGFGVIEVKGILIKFLLDSGVVVVVVAVEVVVRVVLLAQLRYGHGLSLGRWSWRHCCVWYGVLYRGKEGKERRVEYDMSMREGRRKEGVEEEGEEERKSDDSTLCMCVEEEGKNGKGG
jgi:hypothetical protein